MKIGDKVLCTKGCSCGCGLTTGKIYTILNFLGNSKKAVFLKGNGVQEEPVFSFDNTGSYKIELCKNDQQLDLDF